MKSKNLKIALSVLLFSLILSMFVLYTPTPISRDSDAYSAAKAAEHIEVISREPHSVFDPVAHGTL